MMNAISINTTNDKVATTVTISGKEFAIIPLNILNVDNKWQRSVKTAKAKRKIAALMEHWDDNQCRPILVAYNEKTEIYDVIDGGHRVTAAILLGKDALVAEIIRYNGTEEDKIRQMAKLFVEQGIAVDRLTPAEKHSANVLLGVSENLTLDLAARKAGFKLKEDGTRGEIKEKNLVTGYNMALSFAKFAPTALNYTFDVINAIHWNEEDQGLSSKAIGMIGKVFAYHRGEEDRIASGIVHVLLNAKPRQAFANAQVAYSGRTTASQNLLWLEGEVCDYLGIERKYHGQKMSIKDLGDVA